MKPRIVAYKDANKENWDTFVKEQGGGYAFHLYDVIALDRYINDKNISFCIWDDDADEMVLVSQLHIEKII